MDRRVFCSALVAFAAASATASAADHAGLDGTWGGARGSLSAQVIVTGGSVIGFYWRDDYLDVTDTAFSADGRLLRFNFAGGRAVLTRTGERTAGLEVHDRGAVVRLDLKRD